MSGRTLSIPEDIQQQLDHPVDPQGRAIEWEHPYLVFLAEHGRICASEEHERESPSAVVRCGRDVGKSTSMASQWLGPCKVGDLVILAPRLPANSYLPEFFAYQTVRVPEEFYIETLGMPCLPQPGADQHER